MVQFVVFPILVLTVGLGVAVGASILGTLVWCAVHVVRDVVFGETGQIWCPSLLRDLRVKGVPRGTVSGQPFSALRRCERWGSGRIQCTQPCLLRAASA